MQHPGFLLTQPFMSFAIKAPENAGVLNTKGHSWHTPLQCFMRFTLFVTLSSSPRGLVFFTHDNTIFLAVMNSKAACIGDTVILILTLSCLAGFHTTPRNGISHQSPDKAFMQLCWLELTNKMNKWNKELTARIWTRLHLFSPQGWACKG